MFITNLLNICKNRYFPKLCTSKSGTEIYVKMPISPKKLLQKLFQKLVPYSGFKTWFKNLEQKLSPKNCVINYIQKS